jgi:hypothetical protein
MKSQPLTALIAATALAHWSHAHSQQSSSPAAAATAAPAASTSAQSEFKPDDRLLLSGDGATLSGSKGGGGGSLGFLHQATAQLLLGIGGEYQRLADSHWEFGSLNAAFTHALTTNSLWSVRAEGHEGAGRSAAHRFGYSIVAAGLGVAVPGGVGFDLEERQIDVDTSHGSLPKVTLSKSWGKHWLTALAYARSYGGNLNTEYGLARIDFYGPGVNLLAGGSVGRVSPAVLSVNGVLQPQARHLKEGFFGITAPLPRVDLTLLADDIDLAGIKRFTVTLNMTVHL